MLSCIHYLATPFSRGFNCNDVTIRYPYKDSTVSSGVCYLVGSGVNILLILTIEYFNLVTSCKNREGGNDQFQVKVYLRNVYCRCLVWFFGAITSELITDITKVSVGRLRPHFLNVCEPIIVAGNSEIKLDDYCRQASNPYAYVTNFYCSGDPSKQRDARLSFLSGHSSYSAYSATFAVLYIQSSLDISIFGLIKPIIQVLIISLAYYTGLSRVSDYKHHWQDVLAGFLLGTTIASIVSASLLPSFQKACTKFMRGSFERVDRPGQSGEELNQLSY